MSDPNYQGTIEDRERRTGPPERNVGIYEQGESQSRTMIIVGVVVALLVIFLLLWWLL